MIEVKEKMQEMTKEVAGGSAGLHSSGGSNGRHEEEIRVDEYRHECVRRHG